MIKLILARILAAFYDGRNTWIVTEKVDEARDNGYWFFKYLINEGVEKKVFYIIDKKSPDYNKVANLVKHGKNQIIAAYSLTHMILFWGAKYNIVSQPPSDYFRNFRRLAKLRKVGQINVFLQHGITKDNLGHGLDADKSGIDIFITSSVREREAVMQRHGYTETSCILTGLCRFDNLSLKHTKSRFILVMPTFRHWIMTKNDNQIPTTDEIWYFKHDEFFKVYQSFLSSSKLADLLLKYDYQLIFYPHYCTQPFLNLFEDTNRSDRVILASNKHFDVQDLLIKSDLLITDYSSVFFDFAYMNKPEIFYQFDEDKYRGNHYEEGYFNYQNDAFGPIVKTENELISQIEFFLKNGMGITDVYKERRTNFFRFIDNDNCKRTYLSIIKYSNH